jgi:formate hydrogenlyase subunit 6/NADH:ubiquinone oxidoreductase subunit I
MPSSFEMLLSVGGQPNFDLWMKNCVTFGVCVGVCLYACLNDTFW